MTDGTKWIVATGGAKIRVSDEYAILEDHLIPKTLEISVGGDGEPEIYARVTVEESGPRLVELKFTSPDPDAAGISQGDLRSVQVSALVESFPAMFTFRIDRNPNGEGGVVRSPTLDENYVNALRFVGRLRTGQTARDITPQLLARVADVYRANISGHPTKAVEHHFQVSQRMAAEYVSRARRRNLLPPTKRGKKMA